MGTHDASPSAPEMVAPRMDTSTALQRLGQSRDPEAWRAILDAHGMAILNLARRITGDAALAEDVCQETLLQIRADAGRASCSPSSRTRCCCSEVWRERSSTSSEERQTRTRNGLVPWGIGPTWAGPGASAAM